MVLPLNFTQILNKYSLKIFLTSSETLCQILSQFLWYIKFIKDEGTEIYSLQDSLLKMSTSHLSYLKMARSYWTEKWTDKWHVFLQNSFKTCNFCKIKKLIIVYSNVNKNNGSKSSHSHPPTNFPLKKYI